MREFKDWLIIFILVQLIAIFFIASTFGFEFQVNGVNYKVELGPE